MPSKPYTWDGMISETASKHPQARASIDWIDLPAFFREVWGNPV